MNRQGWGSTRALDVRMRRGGNGSRPPPPPRGPALTGPDSPEEGELAGTRGVGRAVFAATRCEPDLSGQPPDERLDPGDVFAPGVGGVGVETLILGDELREFGSEELEERLACPATEEQ